MKHTTRIFLLLLFALLAVAVLTLSGLDSILAQDDATATRTESPTPSETPYGNYVYYDDVYLRGGPGQEFVPVGQLIGGMLIRPVARSADGGWVMISYRQGFGWVRRDLVYWQDNVDLLPVLAAGVTPSPDPDRITETPFFPTATPAGNWANVTGEGAYLRAGPGRTYLVLGSLHAGDMVTPVARVADYTWIMVYYGDSFAWVQWDLVRWQQDLQPLPVIPTDIPDALTPTLTFTPSITPSHTVTPSPTDTPSATPTDTSTPTDTATPTPTSTATPTDTATVTPSDTPTAVPTDTPTETAIPSHTPTDPPSATPTETETPPPSATHTPQAATGITTTDADVYDGPDERFPIIGNVMASTSLNLLGQSEDREWLLVSFSAGQGWVQADYVRIRPGPSELAVFVVASPTNVPTLTPTDTPTSTETATDTATATARPSDTPTETATDVPSDMPAVDDLTGTAVGALPAPPTFTPMPPPPELATETPTPTVTVIAAAGPSEGPPTAVALVPDGAPDGGAPDGGAPSEAAAPPPLSPDLIGAGILALVLGVYLLLYAAGTANARLYGDGFLITTCPVCQKGRLEVVDRYRRFFGIPRVRRTVHCDYCGSVLRQLRRRLWLYTIDGDENPDIYRRYNRQIISDAELMALAALRAAPPPSPPESFQPPEYIEGEPPDR